ncbi:sigma-70 family RNA polymerase sigma factor [Roseateles asaccharophilus]|uniref:DNA-directed RNA polymerase specialized sigma24 family protein n=1 Tax=Roseateles asaccharophilus TaxID=582607 RepID=A0ABU2A7Z7_9BURK|nr:sigma-70 family RNA polymerase sigma factor [Roseateles asaccharophilus]MDR7332728.1 DNA-directed RNA polymerase specialized sigma24 family protein [Roseateles asaccharophilus]
MDEGKEDEEAGQLESRKAVEAARRGDAQGMVSGFFAGGLADWLSWRMSVLYPKLPAQDREDCVAEAVGDAYKALVSGRRISTLPAYLMKAASNNAVDMLRDRAGERSADVDTFSNVRDPAVEAIREQARLRLRKQALVKARELLPLIGMDNICKVMATIFDAIEAGMEEIADSEIADALGMNEETVRRLKSRGFERLRRHAREKGYDLEKYERAIGITETVEMDDEGESDE